MQSSAFKNLYGCRATLRDTFRATTQRRAVPAKAIHTASRTLWTRNSCLYTLPSRCISNKPCHISLTFRQYSSQMTDVVFPDPNRRDIFYHLIYAPTPVSNSLPAFALSFLNEPPRAVDAPSVIGWLPAQAYASDTPEVLGTDQPAEGQSALQDFRENREPLIRIIIISSLR